MNKDPKKREEATTSLTNTYKQDTPGQKKLKTFLEYAYTGTMGSLDLSTIPGPSGAFRPEDTPVKPKKKNKYNQHLETKPVMPLVGY
jgi:hypothetical protein